MLDEGFFSGSAAGGGTKETCSGIFSTRSGSESPVRAFFLLLERRINAAAMIARTTAAAPTAIPAIAPAANPPPLPLELDPESLELMPPF